MSEKKPTFNITYYPAFQNVRSIMEELHILLTPNKEHKKVFPDVPVVGFRNGKYNVFPDILNKGVYGILFTLTQNAYLYTPIFWYARYIPVFVRIPPAYYYFLYSTMFYAVRALRITWLEPDYSNLRRVEDVNHVGRKKVR